TNAGPGPGRVMTWPYLSPATAGMLRENRRARHGGRGREPDIPDRRKRAACHADQPGGDEGRESAKQRNREVIGDGDTGRTDIGRKQCGDRAAGGSGEGRQKDRQETLPRNL